MLFLPPEKYQPAAQRLFEELAAKLLEALPGAQVEHIGASSIPGAVSKGDLDIYVGVSPGELEGCVPIIEELGFTVVTGSLRTDALCPFASKDHDLDVGVQLVAQGSEFEFFLTFRDALRSDETLLDQYNQLKRDSSGLDAESYRANKSLFIEAVLQSKR